MASSPRVSLIDHLESFAGPIESGWAHDPDGNCRHFQIAAFSGGPFDGCRMISTLGLAKHELLIGDGTHGRHELLMLARGTSDLPVYASLLFQVGSECIQNHAACLRGEVIGPRGEIFPNSAMTALYCSAPVYFPSEFRAYEEHAFQVMMLWLVPITTAEAAFVRRNGWPAFEQRLVTTDPDLVDPYRPCVAAPGL